MKSILAAVVVAVSLVCGCASEIETPTPEASPTVEPATPTPELDPVVDADRDGYTDAIDCDDTNPNTYPGATEICDGLDNDCDEQADIGAYARYYADADEDGHGDPAIWTDLCRNDYISGTSRYGDDCDDSDPTSYPGAPAIMCDGRDNACDGAPDGFIFYPDIDRDGRGTTDLKQAVETCDQDVWSAPSKHELSSTHDDCDDQNAAIPASQDIPDNGIDDNCDGLIDNQH